MGPNLAQIDLDATGWNMWFNPSWRNQTTLYTKYDNARWSVDIKLLK